MKKPLTIIMFGRPGSGKGTQAALLAKDFKLEHFSSGEALRARKKQGGFTGKKLGEVMNRGEWVPENTIIKIWLDRMEEFKNKKNFSGWIYDGGPRLNLEADLLSEALKWYEWDENTKSVLIDISAKTALDRLTKRRQCSKCGELIPWVGEFKKIKKCHKCGGELFLRSDDTPAAIKGRIDQFRKFTMPAMRRFNKGRKFIKINGDQPIDKVYKDLLKAIK
jgi:adenylate kinase